MNLAPSSRKTATGAATIEDIRTRLKADFGIHIRPENNTMLEARLSKLARSLGLPGLDALAKHLQTHPEALDVSDLADRMTTNYTYFHRESAHYDYLVEAALPQVLAARKRAGQIDLKVWCAAASSGEEPYEIAMWIREVLSREGSQFPTGLLATDLSAKVLDIARKGEYAAAAVAKLPESLVRRYFTKLPSGAMKVTPELHADVTFRRFNLMNPMPFRSQFDIIFCRNVMIYFDRETIHELLERLYEKTVPGGFLFVGLSESFDRKRCPYTVVRPGIYRRSP
jgi:chemotaxis protein methyltransferase CheR